ncbi:Uncharacterised protein [Vibrio cholerae]|nr:Uncharacterised protein [Vibrio cholerae]
MSFFQLEMVLSSKRSRSLSPSSCFSVSSLSNAS